MDNKILILSFFKMKPLQYQKLPVIVGTLPVRMDVICLITTRYENFDEYTDEDIEDIRKFHQIIIRTLNFQLALRLKEEFWEYDEKVAFTETDIQEVVLKRLLLKIYNEIKILEEGKVKSVPITRSVIRGRGLATYEDGEFHLLWPNQKRKGRKKGETTEAEIVLTYVD